MTDNKYAIGARLYGTASYSQYAHLLTATKTVITVQDFDSPQLLQFRRVTVVGPDLTTPNLLQFRRVAVVGPSTDTLAVKQARCLAIFTRVSGQITQLNTTSTEVSTAPADSAKLVGVRRYTLLGSIADSDHLLSTALNELSAWVPDSVTVKSKALTELSVNHSDSVHLASVRRYGLYASIANATHLLQTTVNALSTQVPNDVDLMAASSAEISTRTGNTVKLADFRRFVLYGPPVTMGCLTTSLSELSVIATNSTSVKQLAQMSVSTAPDTARLAGVTRYTLYGGIPDTVAAFVTSTTELSVEDPPVKIRRRFSYVA